MVWVRWVHNNRDFYRTVQAKDGVWLEQEEAGEDVWIPLWKTIPVLHVFYILRYLFTLTLHPLCVLNIINVSTLGSFQIFPSCIFTCAHSYISTSGATDSICIVTRGPSHEISGKLLKSLENDGALEAAAQKHRLNDLDWNVQKWEATGKCSDRQQMWPSLDNSSL